MFQFLLPIILIVASVGLFFGFTKKQYESITSLRSELVQYDNALQKSKDLLKKRDNLIDIKNSIDPIDLEKLDKLLPNDVNNTKLILEIQSLASNKHGLGFEDPKSDPNKKVTPTTPTGAGSESGDKKTVAPSAVTSPKDVSLAQKEYGIFDLEFTVVGTYDKFIAFVQDLEKSLRIVDIQSIDIAPKEGSSVMKYVIKIKTYWLKS